MSLHTPDGTSIQPLIDAQSAQSREPLPLRPGCLITESDLGEVREIRQGALANCYRLVKVHSPASRYVREASAGKQPCTEKINGQNAPWPSGHSARFLMSVTPATANTGAPLGGDDRLVAWDIDPAKNGSPGEQWDFTQAVLRALLLGRLNRHLRRALIRLRPPGSVVLLFRTDQLVTKRKATGERGALELLGAGQHIVIHGWHPLSRLGHPVRWSWLHDRAPWTVPPPELPAIPSQELFAALDDVAASGVLGPKLGPCFPSTQQGLVEGPSVFIRQTNELEQTRPLGPEKSGGYTPKKFSAYPATARLHRLFGQHNDRVRPAVKQLIEEIGAEGAGRHDALIAVAGRLVHQRWSDEEATTFLLPLINQHFRDGDWSDEISAALAHARGRDSARLQAIRGTTWPK